RSAAVLERAHAVARPVFIQEAETRHSRGRATWLCLLQPRRTMAVDYSTNTCIGCRRKERRARRASTRSSPRTRQCWPRAMQDSDLAMVDAESNIRVCGRRLGDFAAPRFSH